MACPGHRNYEYIFKEMSDSFTLGTTKSCDIMALRWMTWASIFYVVCTDKFYSDQTSEIHRPTQHFNVI
jgi:hypothetical protein